MIDPPSPQPPPPELQLAAAALPLSDLLAGDVVQAAAGLLGCVLERRLPDGTSIRVQLVELEAYHQSEPGCHAHRGRTPRTAVMFGPPGRMYVYFTYGMWHCANIVCEAEGTAAAVLLRAAALYGSPALPASADSRLTAAQPPPRLSGPGLICQTLQLDRHCSGMPLLIGDPAVAVGSGIDYPGEDEIGSLRLFRPPDFSPPPISWTTRVGFSFQDTLAWRCFWTGHPSVGKVSLKPLKCKSDRPERADRSLK